MSVAKEVKKCPFCKETIVAAATRCKHCHADLTKSKARAVWWDRFDTFRAGFLVGAAFILILVALTYLHFTGN